MSGRNRGKEVKGKTEKDKPNSLIYIFCEGDTEQIYLKHFENRIYNVEVIPVDTKHTDALGIVKYAKQYIEDNTLNLEFGDKGYCVFDSDPKSNPDHKIKEAFNIVNGSKNKGLDCIFSNPCFEVWFSLYFGNAPHGLDAKKMKSYVKDKIENEFNIKDYSETTDIYDYLIDKQPEALKRARLLHIAQEKAYDSVQSHECNPYTNIFNFIEHMELIKEQNKLKHKR